MGLFTKKQNLSLAEITPAVLGLWRLRYREGIYTVGIEGKIGYFKILNKKELNESLTAHMLKRNPDEKAEKIKHAEALVFGLIELSWLGGDIELLTNEAYRTELFTKAGEIIEAKIKITFPAICGLINNKA